MKKKYISPRILVEKMDILLLVETSRIPVSDERKPLDAKEYFGGIDADDADEY